MTMEVLPTDMPPIYPAEKEQQSQLEKHADRAERCWSWDKLTLLWVTQLCIAAYSASVDRSLLSVEVEHGSRPKATLFALKCTLELLVFFLTSSEVLLFLSTSMSLTSPRPLSPKMFLVLQATKMAAMALSPILILALGLWYKAGSAESVYYGTFWAVMCAPFVTSVLIAKGLRENGEDCDGEVRDLVCKGTDSAV